MMCPYCAVEWESVVELPHPTEPGRNVTVELEDYPEVVWEWADGYAGNRIHRCEAAA